MTEKRKIAVLISGNGSNLQAIIDAANQPDFLAQIALVISNEADAHGLERAKQAGIATEVISHIGHALREDFDRKMHAALLAANVEFVCLAGFMRLLTPWFINQWPNKLINIHPSLLPAFKGTHAIEQAFDAGVKVTGCTVHFVRPQMDAGPIIAQSAIDILDDDTLHSVAERMHEAEHALYPEVINWLAGERIDVTNERVTIHRLTH